MNTATAPKPFLPSDIPVDRTLIRLATAFCLAAHKGPGESTEQELRQAWPRDAVAMALYQRTATAPATTSTSGWADTLAATAVSAFVGSLRDSAAAALFARGMRVDLTGAASMTLPRANTTGSGGWAAEGAPIVVGQATLAAASLAPRKLALIESLTREIFEHSGPGSEDWMATILRDAATYQLDQALFSNTAGDSTRPPGLVTGVTALTATTGGGLSACTADFRLVTDAIVTAAGGGEILYFMSPGRALAAKSLLPAIAPQIFGSAAIASGVMIGVAAGAFVSAFDPTPSIVASRDTTIHFEDTTPLQLATGAQGSAVLATPTRGMFQTDTIAFRMVLRAGWALRVPATAQWISTGMTW